MSDFVYHKPKCIINVTKIVTIHYHELSKDFQYDGESHDMWEIVYVDKGEIIITAGKKKTLVKQGGIVFLKPFEFHNTTGNKIVAPNLFIITFITSSKAMNYFKGKIFKLPVKYRKYISQLMAEGSAAFEMTTDILTKELKERKDAPVGAQQLIKLYLEEFLLMLIREQHEKIPAPKILLNNEPEGNRLVSSVIRMLSENLYRKISIRDICQHFNYGKTHLCTTFRQNSGHSIMEYYNLLKIAESKRLLRETDYSIGEISYQLCFDSPQYFSKVFKKITDMTPREYRMTVDKFGGADGKKD